MADLALALTIGSLVANIIRTLAQSLADKRLIQVHNIRTARPLVATMVLGLVTACAAPQPPAAWDGLEYRAVRGVDAVHVRPGVEFASYQTVMIDPVEISFDRSWDPNRVRGDLSSQMSAEDIQSLKDDMAREFRAVLAEELARGGYRIVEQPAVDTLRLSPSIVDIYVSAPGAVTPGRSRSYTLEAGRMTLVMELRDGPTGQLLARVVDQQAGTRTGRVQVTSGVSNTADFRRAVSDWARKLREGLDAVNGRTG